MNYDYFADWHHNTNVNTSAWRVDNKLLTARQSYQWATSRNFKFSGIYLLILFIYLSIYLFYNLFICIWPSPATYNLQITVTPDSNPPSVSNSYESNLLCWLSHFGKKKKDGGSPSLTLLLRAYFEIYGLPTWTRKGPPLRKTWSKLVVLCKYTAAWRACGYAFLPRKKTEATTNNTSISFPKTFYELCRSNSKFTC